MNSLQFAQLWLPFGEFRYPTDDCDIFAAAAGYAVANTIGAAMTAQVAPCKTERREIFVDQIFWFSAISAIPIQTSYISAVFCRIGNDDLFKGGGVRGH